MSCFRKKLRKMMCLLLSCIIVVNMCGCNKSTLKEGEYYVYYTDQQCTHLVTDSFKPDGDEDEEIIIQMLDLLSSNTDNVDLFKPIPDDVLVMLATTDTSTKTITVDFSSEYMDMDKSTEVLCRAAVVLTLCQLDSIDYVEFEVEEEPLTDSSGTKIGAMSADMFVDSSGNNFVDIASEDTFTLYFADENYKKLVPYTYEGTYSSNASLETYIIKELIDGPKEQGYSKTLSEDTTLVSAVTTDGTCYVTFGENFEQLNAGINTELTIYSIVNSLSELNYITKVRISINGNTADTYNGVSLDQAFSRNLDILVEE